VLKGYDENVTYVAFDARGRRLLTYSGTRRFGSGRFHRARRHEPKRAQRPHTVERLQSRWPAGRHCFRGQDRSDLDATTGQEVRQFTVHEGPVTARSSAPTAGESSLARLTRRPDHGPRDRTGAPRSPGHTAGILCAAFSPDGRRVITGSSDTTAVYGMAPPAVRSGPSRDTRPLLARHLQPRRPTGGHGFLQHGPHLDASSGSWSLRRPMRPTC